MAPSTADYQKKKVVELQELLKSRSLPHAGKKDELIARLQTHDAEQAAVPSTSASSDAPVQVAADSAPTAAASASTEAGAAAIAAGGKGQPPNPVDVPNQVQAEDPAQTDDLTVKVPQRDDDTAQGDAAAQPTTSDAPKPDFSSHLANVSLDDELEKRKKRAARFGTSVPVPADKTDAAAGDEALKLLERQKRFGASGGSAGGVDVLNRALPERERKRGRGGRDIEGERDGKRRDSRRRNGRGEGRDGAAGGKDDVKGKRTSNEKDRLAAEQRKARFASNK